jgi:hypothetical protein
MFAGKAGAYPFRLLALPTESRPETIKYTAVKSDNSTMCINAVLPAPLPLMRGGGGEFNLTVVILMKKPYYINWSKVSWLNILAESRLLASLQRT